MSFVLGPQRSLVSHRVPWVTASLGHQIFNPSSCPLCPGVQVAQGAERSLSHPLPPPPLGTVTSAGILPPATGFSLLCCGGSVPRGTASLRKGMLGISFQDAGKPVNIKVLNCNFFPHNCF